MTVLITGGCGFIGLNILENLIKIKTKNIIILDNFSNSCIENLHSSVGPTNIAKISKKSYKLDSESSHFEYEEIRVNKSIISVFEGDVVDFELAQYLTRKTFAVIHLAGQTSVQPSISDPEFDYRNNILGTFNYLESSRLNGVKKFITASSAAVLGNSPSPQEENYPYQPLSPYGASKAAIEAYCSAYKNSYNINTIALRFSNVYGAYAWNKGSVVAKFIKDTINDKTIVVNGDGNQTRDFLHVQNICQVILKILSDEDSSLFEYGKPLNIATGKQTSILDVIDLMQEYFHSSLKYNHGPELKGDVKTSSPSVKKLRNYINVEKFFTLEDKLEECINWFKNNYKK